MLERSAFWTGGLLICGLIGIGAVLYFGGSSPDERITSVPEASEDPISMKIRNEMESALSLQESEQWCESQEKWQQILDLFAEELNVRSRSPLRNEIDSNLRITRSKCQPQDAVTGTTLPGHRDDHRPSSERPVPAPDPVPEDALVHYYPKGKSVRSIALMNITGRGRNRAWIFETNAEFAYQHRMLVETKVVESNETRITFEVTFAEVEQLRAVSASSVELVTPQSPIVKQVWGQIDRNLRAHPVYQVARTLGDVADPQLKTTLTNLRDKAKEAGFQIPDTADVQLARKVESLAGHRVRMDYVSGIGVTFIDVLEGELMERDLLERLAYCGGWLMDYVVGREAEEPVGHVFEVQVEDIAGMIGFGYDVTPSGMLHLSKRAHEGGTDVLEVVGGELTVRGSLDGIERSGIIRPKPGGDVRYNSQRRFVQQARMSWDANLDWVSTDHLLFGTSDLAQVKVESYYEATAADDEEAGN